MSAFSFQNMAPNAQRSFLLTLGLGAVAIIVYLFLVQPAAVDLAQSRSRFTDLDSQRQAVMRDLRGADKVKAEIRDLEAARKPYLDALLTPLLASRAMRAKAILDPLALGAGLEKVDYAEGDARALPLPNHYAKQLYTRIPIHVSCRGSYADLISFLLRVERDLPYTALQSIRITASPNDPTTHQGAFTFEWPAKGVLSR